MGAQEAVRVTSPGAVFWAEAVADGSAQARAFAGTQPDLTFTLTSALPRGISLVTQPRGVVVLGAPAFYDHAPTAAELGIEPSVAGFSLSGTVVPADGGLNPRAFTAAIAMPPAALPLWPSPNATRIGEAGALALSLVWSDGAPASWCIVRLACSRSGQSFQFAGQCSGAGDVVVPLTGLPPLPQGQPADSMVLTASGLRSQSGAALADPDVQGPVQVAIGGAYAAQQSIGAVRGAFNTTASLGLAAVTLKEP